MILKIKQLKNLRLLVYVGILILQRHFTTKWLRRTGNLVNSAKIKYSDGAYVNLTLMQELRFMGLMPTLNKKNSIRQARGLEYSIQAECKEELIRQQRDL